MSELQAHHCMTPQQWTGLPDKNFNKKPNNAKKRPKKGQTDCSKARKKAKLYLRYCHSFVTKTSKLQEYQKFFFDVKIKSCLALFWSTDLPWLFMVCEIPHFGSHGPTVCIFIHRQLSDRKSLLFTPVLTIRIKKAFPLRRNYRISIEKTQTCLQALRLFSAYNTIGTAQCSGCSHFQWLRKNLMLDLAFIKYY